MSVRHVVVGVDGSPGSAPALDWALGEADRREVPLRVVSAWTRPVVPRHGRGDDARGQAAVAAALDDAVASAVGRTGRSGVAVEREAVRGHAAEVLVGATGPDSLVVVGSRGHGPLRGLLLGSTSQSLAHHARGPVVVVPPAPPTTTRGAGAGPARGAAAAPRVVVGVDGSPGGEAALRFAAEAARRSGAVLHVVHAWLDTVSGYGGPLWEVPRTTLEQAADAVLRESLDALGDPGVQVRAETVEGLDYGVLLDAAETADLLVVGSRGRGGWLGLRLGSVGLHAMAGATCPVALVHPADA